VQDVPYSPFDLTHLDLAGKR